jgi:hypothetical protein
MAIIYRLLTNTVQNHLLIDTFLFFSPNINVIVIYLLQALYCFFQAHNVEMWNPVAPIATFWEIRYLLCDIT